MTDAISRSALIETLDTLIKIAQQNENDDAERVMVVAATCVKGAPALDVAPVVHAHWVQEDEDTWSCSGCGVFWTFFDGGPADNGADYCPHCGARMDG